MNTSERIKQIDQRIEQLATERKGLEETLKRMMDDKWSKEGMTERLRKVILSRFGSVHPIKMAKLVLNGVYNDEYDDYENPMLMLIDKDFNDIQHDIDPRQFCPSSREQSDHYGQTRQSICDSVTLRFP